MNNFLELEAGNLTIALFFLIIAIFVSTRPFVKTQVKKFILFSTVTFFVLLIAGHYLITIDRMKSVKEVFKSGKEVECESRLNRKAAQSVTISKRLGWKLENGEFSNPLFSRKFHSSRCIVKVKPEFGLPDKKQK